MENATLSQLNVDNLPFEKESPSLQTKFVIEYSSGRMSDLKFSKFGSEYKSIVIYICEPNCQTGPYRIALPVSYNQYFTSIF